MNEATLFSNYADPFAGIPGNASAESPDFRKTMRKLRKIKRKNKELKKTIKEQRAAEEKAVAQKKETSLLSKIGEAIVKAIPVVLTAIAGFFMKGLFSRQNELKCKCA